MNAVEKKNCSCTKVLKLICKGSFKYNPFQLLNHFSLDLTKASPFTKDKCSKFLIE